MNPFPEESKAHSLLEGIRAEIPTLGLAPGPRTSTDWPREVSAPDDEELLGGPVADGSMASAVRSGLLLRADRLEESHVISQSIPTPTGNFWHGIMHRREGDFGNSKYWFRRVGEHDIFPDLAREAALVGGEATGKPYAGGRWDPFHFVDLCESRFSGRRDALTEEIEALQDLEIRLLLDFSFRRALGR